MPVRRIALAATAALALATTAFAQQPPTLQLPRTSQKAVVTQTIGTTEMSVTYHRPGVKGRAVWGALVPWNEPWRTGANEATRFVTSTDVTVEGQPLPAGSYAIVTIPTQDRWTVIFSKQTDMWGAFGYKPEEDQLRVEVTPQPAEHQEWMSFTFDEAAPSGTTLSLRWEKVRVPVKIDIDVNGRVVADARAAVAAAKPDDWRTPYRAANWANDAGLVPEEASQWAQSALKAKENFQTLALVARLTAKAGDTKTAIAQMTKAVALGKADKDANAEMVAGQEKLLAEWLAAATPAKGKRK